MSIYLDWAATSPPEIDIINASIKIAHNAWANPSSNHEAGKKAATRLGDARERAAKAFCVDQSTIYFTSGGTEANHLPLLSLLTRPVKGSIAISSIEHPAIAEQARMLGNAGWKILSIPCNQEGHIEIETVLKTITEDTLLVAIMAVNNETGAIQPVFKIAKALKEKRIGKRPIHFHVDAVQAVGKMVLEPGLPGIDSLAISAHKIGGPRGSGLLYAHKRFEAFIRGGGQESGIRPGTENLFGAWALSLCLERATSIDSINNGYNLVTHLFNIFSDIPGIKILPETRTAEDKRYSPWIIQISNEKIPGEVIVRALSDAQIYVSTGSACSSKKGDRPVLQAMQVTPEIQQNAFRVSMGRLTTPEELDIFAREFRAILNDTRSSDHERSTISN